jgi:hypothetical protein
MCNHSISLPFLAGMLMAAVLPATLPVALHAQTMNKTILVEPPRAGKKAAKPDTKAAAKAEVRPAAKPDAPLLPSGFSGWDTAAPPSAVHDASLLDSVNVAALKEYGFSDGMLGDYTRGSDTLQIKALRFTDASGAYGAYSFYRHSGWPKEDVGSGATSDHNRVLFWRGNVVIDSTFSHVSAMTGSELRELARTLPVPTGNKSVPPPILGDLPQKDMDGQTTHYALGPLGYAGPRDLKDPIAVLPPELVGFDHGAETATATYQLRSGPAILTIINYPTPQLAATQEQAIAAYLKAGNSPQHPFTKPLQDSNLASLEVRRSGPLVAVVSGDAIAEEAHKLLETVHYEADTSAIQGQVGNEVQKAAKMLLAIVSLVVVMFAAAVLLAIFLGGGRAAYRWMRGKPLSSVYDEEFTKLDLG